MGTGIGAPVQQRFGGIQHAKLILQHPVNHPQQLLGFEYLPLDLRVAAGQIKQLVKQCFATFIRKDCLDPGL